MASSVSALLSRMAQAPSQWLNNARTSAADSLAGQEAATAQQEAEAGAQSASLELLLAALTRELRQAVRDTVAPQPQPQPQMPAAQLQVHLSQEQAPEGHVGEGAEEDGAGGAGWAGEEVGLGCSSCSCSGCRKGPRLVR
jgi:hypothetical protein